MENLLQHEVYEGKKPVESRILPPFVCFVSFVVNLVAPYAGEARTSHHKGTQKYSTATQIAAFCSSCVYNCGYGRTGTPGQESGDLLRCHRPGGRVGALPLTGRRGSLLHAGWLMALDVGRVRALCFDVDGTLSDTDDIFVEIIAASLTPWRALWPRFEPRRAARRLVMLAEAPGNALLGLPDWLGLDRQMTALINFGVRALPPRQHHFRIVPGVQEMLSRLAGRYPLSVVSTRDERSTRYFLDQYGLSPFFTAIVTALTAEHTKPYPDPILFAAARMGVPPEACLMIGDTTVDIRAGKAAGAQTVGVLCGFGEERELRRRGADLVLRSTPQVAEVLLGDGEP